MNHSELSEKDWEELAIRWGRQLSELIRAFNRTFDVNLNSDYDFEGLDNPSDIILVIRMKERESQNGESENG